MHYFRLRTKLSVAAIVTLGTILLGAVQNETGQLKILRTGPNGAMGQPIDVTISGAATNHYTLRKKPSTLLTMPVGWYQLNCRAVGQKNTQGSTIEIRKDSVTTARCYFPKVVPVEDTFALADSEVSAHADLGHAADPSSAMLAPTTTMARKPQVLFHAKNRAKGRSKAKQTELLVGRGATHSLPITRRHAARARMQLGGGVAAAGLPASQHTENYNRIDENEFKATSDNPLSTLSIDVDTAAYANSRRYIQQMRRLPPKDAVRIEEFINYFDYDYAQPEGDAPFAVHTEVSTAPWNTRHRLVHIGVQGKDLDMSKAPASNLVFLIDVSGSMRSRNKLPLLISGFKMLVDQLRPQDRVAIVVYASREGLHLPSTSGAKKDKIHSALNRLYAGGSTAGGAGIKLAYKVARENFIEGGVNRVILATDGDFNVGVSSTAALERMVESQSSSNVFLTVLGFGQGNYKDARMEGLSNKGNGNAAYIDSALEARKVLVNEMGGTLVTIAKDVKIQIEFNPAKVKGYRLIGYENRLLAAQDFNDDTKDAGELGAGHTVTALYEVIPPGSDTLVPGVDPLRYQDKKFSSSADQTTEMLMVKLRYKSPTGNRSKLISQPLIDHEVQFENTSNAFRFSTAVAEFGMLLRDSKHRGNASYASVIKRAEGSKGLDTEGYRAAFVDLVRRANALAAIRN